eukprot:3624575-Rhodomonas_salina.1
MICHLNGYGLHAYTTFPEKCNALSYSQSGRFHSLHRDYWMLKMWLGEPDFDYPVFMPAPYTLAYTPQLILRLKDGSTFSGEERAHFTLGQGGSAADSAFEAESSPHACPWALWLVTQS